ncbi:MAG: arginine decarboxylase, partial [Rivularia sp. (in: cyanobacteria)]
LLVDEAHGAHFAFHPELPISALNAGADLTVQSIHKTLGGMTQASMLHVQGERININRVNKALQLTQSTSPSYILLASLDAARQQIALQGKELLTQTLQLAQEARKYIDQIPGLSVFEHFNLDKTRLTVTVSQLEITGFEAEEILDEKLNVTPEFASLQHLTFIISLGNTAEDIEQLVKALTTLAKEYKKPLLENKKRSLWNNFPELNTLQLSPRQAFFSSTETLPIKEAINRISAETVCPYPPGIPFLIPGEIITSAVVEHLLNVKAMGGFISNCADTSLCSLKVVRERG